MITKELLENRLNYVKELFLTNGFILEIDEEKQRVVVYYQNVKLEKINLRYNGIMCFTNYILYKYNKTTSLYNKFFN